MTSQSKRDHCSADERGGQVSRLVLGIDKCSCMIDIRHVHVPRAGSRAPIPVGASSELRRTYWLSSAIAPRRLAVLLLWPMAGESPWSAESTPNGDVAACGRVGYVLSLGVWPGECPGERSIPRRGRGVSSACGPNGRLRRFTTRSRVLQLPQHGLYGDYARNHVCFAVRKTNKWKPTH